MQYPVVEFATGIMFVVAHLGGPVDFKTQQAAPLQIFFTWFILSALLVIFVIDLKHYIIPDKILFPVLLIVLVYRIVVAQLAGPANLWAHQGEPLQYILSGIGAAGFFLLLILFTKGKGMGFGDVKYAFFMGLLLGYPAIIVSLYTAFLTGAFIGVILILSKKRKFGQIIPFGPFLVIGTLVGMYFGDYLWRLFAGLY